MSGFLSDERTLGARSDDDVRGGPLGLGLGLLVGLALVLDGPFSWSEEG